MVLKERWLELGVDERVFPENGKVLDENEVNRIVDFFCERVLADRPINQECRVVVCIPAFRESLADIPPSEEDPLGQFGISRLLQSLYEQTLPFEQYEVLLLINAAKDADEETVRINNALYYGVKVWSNIYSKLKLHILNASGDMYQSLINSYSGYGDVYQAVPSVCNVGVARDLLAKIALRRMGGDLAGRAIAYLDADSWVSTDYLDQQLQELDYSRAEAVVSRRQFTLLKGEEDRLESLIFLTVEGIRSSIWSTMWEFWERGNGYDELDDSLMTAGSNLFVGASHLNDVGGFMHISGAEDVMMGERILATGGKIVKSRALQIVQTRLSERAEAGMAHGPFIGARLDHDLKGFMPDPDVYIDIFEFQKCLRDGLSFDDALKSIPLLQGHVTKSEYNFLLDCEQLMQDIDKRPEAYFYSKKLLNRIEESLINQRLLTISGAVSKFVAKVMSVAPDDFDIVHPVRSKGSSDLLAEYSRLALIVSDFDKLFYKMLRKYGDNLLWDDVLDDEYLKQELIDMDLIDRD